MQVKALSTPSFGTTQKRKNINYVKITGYGALASGIACALTAKKRKTHKTFALSALLLTLAHIGILQSYKFRKNG